MPANITPEIHRLQIEAYVQEYPRYATYARALERVFTAACAVSVPQAIVQARPKSVSSFAEKCVRKFDKYPDPVHQLTDLCGARVIVQTLEQVRAVRLFVEDNFQIVERDDKTERLGDREFGYRDMHYLIRLRPDRAEGLGLTPPERDAIGDRVAELQVRSVVQHGWADIIHDRLYKTPLQLSVEARRTAARLGAVMEDGDRSFDRLAGELDGMAANYVAYASRDEVEREIGVQNLILGNEPQPEKRPHVALRLARLLGPGGAYQRVIEILGPLGDTRGDARGELLLELGHALCRVHRDAPASAEYQRGERLLRDVVDGCNQGGLASVPNLRKQRSLLARAWSRLAWCLEAVPHSEGAAREAYRQAREVEPANPYHLANQLGFEIFCQRDDSMIDSMRTTIRLAVAACRAHALAEIELPYSLFTAGRLSLLLGDTPNALAWYARGLRHLHDGTSAVSNDVLEDETQWIRRIHFGSAEVPHAHDWVLRLVELGRAFDGTSVEAPAVAEPRADSPPAEVLIVVGGAATMTPDMLESVRAPLREALASFQGSVISGGTTVGIPGCVGDLAQELARAGRKRFELVAYIPRSLPQDAPKDARYDRFEIVGEDARFSPGEVLRTWEDLRARGLAPARVRILGFGGGPVSAFEYRVALAFGAQVGVVRASGGSGAAILDDPLWVAARSLLELPLDAASMRAFVTSASSAYEPAVLQEMGKAFHERYLSGAKHDLPANLRSWKALPETFQAANLEQARYAVEILRAAGFDVRPVTGIPPVAPHFSPDDIERMAELEHGRWNVERLRDGWRPGVHRDDGAKIHDCLVPWHEVPEQIRQYDRDAVRAFPDVLARANLEVFPAVKGPIIHDYFVSYNSHDVVPARRITERLLADGRRVWFNEYKVPSDQQANFQSLINTGLGHSRSAILVVGERYAASPYCNIEVERILRLVARDRIFLAVLDEREPLSRLLHLYPELSDCARWPPEGEPAVILGRHEWVVREAGFAFDNSVWAIEPASLFHDTEWGAALGFAAGQRRAVRHTFVATEELDARLIVDYEPLEGPDAANIQARYARTDEDVEAEDRRRLKEELKYFESEAKQVFATATRHAGAPADASPPGAWARWRSEHDEADKYDEIGVHLFSLRLTGREIKQRLFSFRLSALPAIFRTYKISFIHPLFNDLPFVIRFTFRFPDDRSAFFRGIPVCDGLVRSLRLLGESMPTTDQMVTQSSDFARRIRGG